VHPVLRIQSFYDIEEEMLKIIDISSANGFVHWPWVGESIDAVILKAADGHYEDNYSGNSYTMNRLKADKYGVPVAAVYGWWYPSRADQTTASMANALHKLACGSRTVLDLELRSGVAWQVAFKVSIQDHLNALDQLGGVPTVAYIGAPMLSCLVNPDGTYPLWLTSRPIWWAQYPNRKVLPYGVAFDQWNPAHYAFQAPTNIPAKFPVKPWLWQISGNGVIPGVPGNSADLNLELNPL
jgi:GH25 family lysozyme M1 (1,4-beta-N-acetylmuramidase)